MRSAPTQASVTAAWSVNLFARTHIPGRWPTRRPAGKGGALCSSTAKGNHRQCHDAQGALSANQSIQMVAEGRALTLTDPAPSLRRLYSTRKVPSVSHPTRQSPNLPISQSPSVATPLLYSSTIPLREPAILGESSTVAFPPPDRFWGRS